MRIKLKKDWDIPIQPPTLESNGIGHFAGRKREVELLVNEILHKNQGSILVGGYRGVGKTSTVYKALSEAKSKEKNLIVVLLNAAQLEAESYVKTEGHNQNKIAPEKIIQNLIRRLYSTTKDSNSINKTLKENIENLYRKAIASEFKLKENYQKQTEFLSEVEKEENSEILLSEKNIKILIFLVSFVFAAIFQVFKLTPWDMLNKILPLFLAFPIPYAINISYKRRKIQRTKNELKGAAEELYQFDNNIGNLEFDLEEIHKELHNNGKKLVYVIDELDKLDPEQVKNVLKFFKNLFTLSKALFIFVGGEELFSEMKKKPEKPEIYRTKEYTYFTSKYFFARPMWKDLNEYINEIIEEKEIDNDNFENLKHSLTFNAINDFFDLITIIKDRIIKFDKDGYSIIEMDNFSNDDILKFQLHKLLTLVFEEKYLSYEHSQWYENENILRALYSHIRDNILSQYSGHSFQDSSIDSTTFSAIRDFNALLYRLGILNIISEMPQNIRGLPVQIRTYQYTGNINITPPSKLDEPSEIEKRFINEFKKYCEYIISVSNIVLSQQNKPQLKDENFWINPTNYTQMVTDFGFNATSVFNSYHSIYKTLISMKPPYLYRREIIEENTKQMLSFTDNMFSNLFIILSNIIRNVFSTLNLQIQRVPQNSNLFSGSAAQVRDIIQHYSHQVIFKPDYSRQILLLPFNPSIKDKLHQMKKVIEDNAATHNILIIGSDEEKLGIKGVYQINYETPSKLLSSSNNFLLYLNNKFFKI
ncbi:MAG: P-loop NTPase fold protein [bacterium]